MRTVKRVPDTEEAKARSRLLTHFIDNPETVFYSRQLEVLFEKEFFHWVTNRALRALVDEGHVKSEGRQLDIGSEMKLVWYRTFRFYKRAGNAVFDLVNRYTNSATDGTLGMQGEHLVLAAFARRQFVLVAEESSSYRDRKWASTGHDLDFIFERDGRGFGIEVKNTLGYMDIDEFVTKIRLARHIGVTPIFAVRYLPATWIDALVKSGGYAMIMKYQFYPWTHQELAGEIRTKLQLPVDTPKKIETGTMMRLEKWMQNSLVHVVQDERKVEALLRKIESANKPKP